MSYYYLAGPYSCDPQKMYEWHKDAQRYIERKTSCVIYSPIVETHQWHKEEPHDYEYWMSRDMEMLEDATGLIRLPGVSPGADREVEYALRHGIPVWMGDTPVDDFVERKYPSRTFTNIVHTKPNKSPCLEAHELTTGDRNADYGHPADDFAKVVGAVNSFFAHKLKHPFEITDWPLIMQCVKIAREVHKPKRDNRVDGAGYWNCLQMIHDRDAQQNG